MVLRVVLAEREPAEDPLAGLAGVVEDAGREGSDPDVGDVESAGGECGEPAFVGGQYLLDEFEFLVQDRHLTVPGGVEGDRADDRPPGHGHHDVHGVRGRDVVQQNAESAIGLVGLGRVQGRLVRFLEADVDESRLLGQRVGGLEDLAERCDLFDGRQRQRVVDTRRGKGGHVAILWFYGC